MKEKWLKQSLHVSQIKCNSQTSERESQELRAERPIWSLLPVYSYLMLQARTKNSGMWLKSPHVWVSTEKKPVLKDRKAESCTLSSLTFAKENYKTVRRWRQLSHCDPTEISLIVSNKLLVDTHSSKQLQNWTNRDRKMSKLKSTRPQKRSKVERGLMKANKGWSYGPFIVE